METRKAKTKVAATVLALAGLLVFSLFAVGGSLEPSAPPGPTMKTLDEVEPRIPISQADIPLTISTPGSYYLTEDVNSSGTAITVTINDVTIDLMGYTIKGPDAGTNYGIYMSGRSNVEIRNGTVRDFYDGILENSTSGQGHRVIRVRSVSNGLHGIFLRGSGNLIKDCTVSDNGISASNTIYGIFAGEGSTVIGNTAYNNGTSVSIGYVNGIYTSLGCTVTGNTAYNNGTSADKVVYGISAGGGSTVTGNTAYNNGHYGKSGVYGIHVDNGCTVIGNTAFCNGIGSTGVYGWGIHLAGNNLVDQNTAYNNNITNPNIINMNNPGNCTFGTNYAP